MPDKTFHIKPPRKIGERYQYMDLTFWPKNGFIYVEDRSDNQFHTISRRDWLLPVSYTHLTLPTILLV